MPDGSFHPCERTGNVMSIGNTESGIVAQDVRRLQTGFRSATGDRCRDCWALRFCGVCFAAQAGQGGQVTSASCDAQRRAQEHQLVLAARTLQLPRDTRAWLDATSVK
ncbi:MAG: SPASM domain-containing protein [bacterium]|nr:SPASM domain-containing protein [bacterium]